MVFNEYPEPFWAIYWTPQPKSLLVSHLFLQWKKVGNTGLELKRAQNKLTEIWQPASVKLNMNCCFFSLPRMFVFLFQSYASDENSWSWRRSWRNMSFCGSARTRWAVVVNSPHPALRFSFLVCSQRLIT